MVIILVKLCILLVGFCAEFVTQLLSVERKAKKVTKKRQQASELKRDHPYITSAKGLGGWIWKMQVWLTLSTVFILTE
jgi:hypothetical protein